jgi:hypothetical protein
MMSQEILFPGKLRLKGDMASTEAQAEGLTAGEREPPGLRFQVRLYDARPGLKGQRWPLQNQARTNTRRGKR